MQATAILMSEHRVIEQVLNCLEKITQGAAADGKVDREAAWQALAFFQTFAGRCHHAKEEQQLFPVLEARGFSRTRGPVGVLLHEHELGSRYLAGLGEVIDAAAAGDAVALRDFAMYANAYVRLLREHILKEEQCLFPVANQTLSANDQQSLLAAFAQVENGELPAGTHEEYLHIADELAQRMGVARAPRETAAAPGRGSCGHCEHAAPGSPAIPAEPLARKEGSSR